MICGEEIYPDDQDAGALECSECYTEYRCSECGDAIGEDDRYYSPDGECLCYDCYDRICTTCACCDDTVYRDDTVEVTFPLRKNTNEKFKELFTRERKNGEAYNPDFAWMFRSNDDSLNSVSVCPDCASRYNVHDVEYTEEDEKKYGVQEGEYTVFNPNKISMQKALHILNAPGFEYAEYVLGRIGRGYYVSDTPEDTREYYQAIYDFWTDQWNRFKKEFDECCEK